MTDKITLELTLDELKLIDKYVELNDDTQSVFDKIKVAYPQPQMTLQQEGEYAVVSFNDKVYYRLQGDVTFSWYIKKGVNVGYPVPTLMMVNDAETERLLESLYYNHIQVKKEKVSEEPEVREWDVVRESMNWCKEHPDKDPLDWVKPQTPEQVADGLKEAFREAVKQGIIHEVDKVSDVFMNEMVEKLKGQTLYDVIADWWDDTFTKKETSLQELVDKIEEWLPKEQSAAGSQNVYVECTVEGFNDCLNTIKRKLR